MSTGRGVRILCVVIQCYLRYGWNMGIWASLIEGKLSHVTHLFQLPLTRHKMQGLYVCTLILGYWCQLYKCRVNNTEKQWEPDWERFGGLYHTSAYWVLFCHRHFTASHCEGKTFPPTIIYERACWISKEDLPKQSKASTKTTLPYKCSLHY